jgi:two-component sensor histidine kinase
VEQSDEARPRAPGVRQHLLLMALSLVLPAVIFMVLLAKAEYDNSQSRYEAQLIATTRALALATDRQISQGQATLQALAVSPALQTKDFKAFDAQARGALHGKPGWIVLFAKDRQVVNTLAPAGAPPPSGALAASAWREFESGWRVSNLAIGPVSHQPIVAINMPLVIDGEVYNLSYIQNPRSLNSIFTAQNLPSTWTATILDRNTAIVARSRAPESTVGRRVSPVLGGALARKPEGSVLTQTIEGVKTLTAFSRSPGTGWSFVVGVPRSELRAQAINSVTLIALAATFLLAIGVSGAVLVGRRISRDMRSLVAGAQAITRGEAVAPRPEDLDETSEVRRALRHASSELQERERERTAASARQQVMINELNHRVKNTLATVQSLARQSLGRSDPEGRRSAFIDRLLALSRAHDLLTRRVWENAELGEVIAQTLEPYRDQARIYGPTIWLSANAAVTLSMVLHEMATNAAKYGALSRGEGGVEVSWQAPPEAPDVVITWAEYGGPAVAPPARDGFGSRLIAAALKNEFGGEAVMDYRPEGLVCTLRLPLSSRVSRIRVPEPAPDLEPKARAAGA